MKPHINVGIIGHREHSGIAKAIARCDLNARATHLRMDPDRFTIGERVRYVNHVTGEDLGMLEVVTVDSEFITAKRFFAKNAAFKFHRDGRATWSANLAIIHA